MKKTLLAVALTLATSSAGFADEDQKKAIMYKPMQCPCCDVYADYLEENGFEVEVRSMRYSELMTVKKMTGVPEGFEGCHTLSVDGYVVDGLVPIKTLSKLLTERPEIRGITLPGMPMGAPGMGGAARKTGPLTIYQIATGTPTVYAVE